MNMVGQNTPWGTLDYDESGSTWIIDPNGKRVEIPSYTANVNLTPEQQAIFEQSQQTQHNLSQLANQQSDMLQNYLGQGIDFSGLPDLASDAGQSGDLGDNYNDQFDPNVDLATSYAGADDFSADRQAHTDALLARMAPQMQQDETQLRNTLINQGIRPGTTAWDREMNRLQSGVTDARLAAHLAGGQEQQRMVDMSRDAAMFGNQSALAGAQFGSQQQQLQNQAAMQQAGFANQANMANAQFQNQARGQGMSELFAQRNQPINEITALMSGSQVQNPNQTFAQTPQSGVAGVDYTGLVNQKYQADLANYQSGMGGLFGLGSALIGALPFSDERLKTDIRKVGETGGGTPVYTFRYKGEHTVHMGVMAQDVPQARVVDPETGFYRVNYERVH